MRQTVSAARRAADCAGKRVTVSGWVRTVRRSKNVAFVEVNDGSSLKSLQVVAPPDVVTGDVTVGSSVSVSGLLQPGPPRHGDDMELQVEDTAGMKLIGGADVQSYPLQKKYHTPETLREYLHLRPRTNNGSAMLRVRNAASRAIRNFFHDEDFLEVHAPVITSNDCEGAGELFRVAPRGQKEGTPFFGADDAYLTVSAQLHAEIFASSMSRVYTFGPTFRAENSNTSRHLCEFYMLEPEIAFASMEDAYGLAQKCVASVVSDVSLACAEDLNHFQARVDEGLLERLGSISSTDFAVMTYTEAVETLQSASVDFTNPVSWGLDLQTEHERYLAETHFQGPVVVTDYPAAIKPFYMRRNDDGKTVGAFDVLVPGIGELVGGSAREERLDLLERSVGDANAAGALDWYLDLRRYGSVPHAGWGLGFERLVMMLTGVSNIRDTVPVPRAPGWCPL